MGTSEDFSSEIAIVGMAGRFPRAANLDQFWRNLRDGVEGLTTFSDAELAAIGATPALLDDPRFVKAGMLLEDAELFDAEFFDFNPREAELMDPQHRVFLECAWEALESAGYISDFYTGSVGVFAGVATNTYLLFNLYSNQKLIGSVGNLQTAIGNKGDFLTTRVSYKLNLRGPSINVQTACSTSLVAIHLACQSLLGGECDMALAGGVSISFPQVSGYLYQEGGVLSPDGHCRSFDASARGTVAGRGVGAVALKRLDDAIADRNYIHAIIKGSALNNDGAMKVGYTAPSVEGQAQVIAEAQSVAGVHPDTVSYIETHGTATALNDPIEMAALSQVFRARTQRIGFCAIGSVKTNIGHLDAAAGIAGLIKTVLALKHRQLPPSLHFSQPNPQIDFASSPFYVNTTLSEWRSNGHARRAGVSALGIGGTNAHIVLEEAPVIEPSTPARPWQLLMISAKSPAALDAATANVAEHLRLNPNINLADASYTLLVGRRAFNHRRVLVARDVADAASALQMHDSQRMLSSAQPTVDRPIAFMFSGLGDQYVQMTAGLYLSEPTVRKHVDRCSELLRPLLGIDLREVLYPGGPQASDEARPGAVGLDLRRMLQRTENRPDPASERLNQTLVAQPALFVIEYALAQLWMEWGVRPQAIVGYSIGEYVAACLAGVMSLEDALKLVAWRARLIQELPPGAMLAVPLSEDEVRPLLGVQLSLSAINGPSLCVVAGPPEAIAELERGLATRGLVCRRLQATHAFHSTMMEPIAEVFASAVEAINLRQPSIPYISNVTGTWITAEQATDPRYWARHLCMPIRFADGVRELWAAPGRVLLEIGPGQTLCTLALQHPAGVAVENRVVLPSIRYTYDRQPDRAFLLSTAGQLWLAGIALDFPAMFAYEQRSRISLPTYPFQRQRYWIEPQKDTRVAERHPASLEKRPDVADWFYTPSWQRAVPLRLALPHDQAEQSSPWLMFVDAAGLGARLAQRMIADGHSVISIRAGQHFAVVDEHTYTIGPGQLGDYEALCKHLAGRGMLPHGIIHCWCLTCDDRLLPLAERFEAAQARGFSSLIFLTQALNQQKSVGPLRIAVVTNGAQDLTGDEILQPEKTTIFGPCKVIPQEYPHITCRSIDVILPEPGSRQEERLVGQLIEELRATPENIAVAYRGDYRWVQIFEPIRLESGSGRPALLREGGSYVIVGGLETVGLTLATYLTETASVNVALVDSATLPSRDEWQRWLDTHDAQDSTGRQIQRLLKIEHSAANVTLYEVDLLDERRMQATIELICERTGGLQGVIYAAGIRTDSSFTAISELHQADVDTHFHAKVHALWVLERVLRGQQLDFCLALSSLSSVLGGLGLAAYSAANSCMDAFVSVYGKETPVPWMALNWDRTVALEEIPAVFQHLWSGALVQQVVVCTSDLKANIDKWIRLATIDQTAGASDSDIAPTLHLRPNLHNPYIAPESEVEHRIAEIWQVLLGIKQLGTQDNFFQLGGHSLLATQLIARVRDIFQVDIPLRAIFEMPTIAELALIVEEALIADLEADQLCLP
jgi:acyl transferase domain-containing protein